MSAATGSTRYPAPSETIARYDLNPTFIVVDAKERVLLRHLGGIPSPALIEAASYGKPVEAWRTKDGLWRLRDDRWDAKHKPADVEYLKVYVGHTEPEEY